MFDNQGLSLNQAPPISVVFRFFLTGLLFGIAGSIAAIGNVSHLFDPSHPTTIATVHAFGIGVMLFFMFGALFQMLPVVAGVAFQAPLRLVAWVHPLLIVGTLALLVGFAWTLPLGFRVALIVLVPTLLFAATAMLRKLFALSNHGKSSFGMLIALLGLVVAVIAAAYLVAAYGGWHTGEYFSVLKKVHYGFAAWGWIATLIVAVSFQVVEMFYVTPPYPAVLTRWLPPALFGILILAFTPLSALLYLGIAGMLSLYAIATLYRFYRRKRPIADATVRFWLAGMVLLIIAVWLLAVAELTHQTTWRLYGTVAFGGFALSIVWAMFYKIVPFLTWFHLNAQGYLNAPMMHEIIHPKTAMRHFYLHLGVIIAWGIGIGFEPIRYIAAGLLLGSFGIGAYGQLRAWRLYRRTQRNGTKFTMPPMEA